MDSEFLNNSLSIYDEADNIKRERDSIFTSRSPYTEIFNRRFPYYLSIGMSPEQYWEQDCTLVKFYREAEKIRTERVNQEAWLQGMYIYDALVRVSPIFRAFAKKGVKAQSYVEEAYPIGKKAVDAAKNKKEKEKLDSAKRYMEAYMVSNNQHFERKGRT